MATATNDTQPLLEPEETHPLPRAIEVRIYSHSPFFYWWPLWAVGYLFALIIYVSGTPVSINGQNPPVLFSQNQTLGVIYTLVLFGVIVITNLTFRGLSSFTLMLAIAFAALALAYFGLWDPIARWLPHLTAQMNMGFYVFFSTLIFVAWFFAFAIYDRLTYWRVRPGQVTQDHIIGGAQKTFDTDGMVVEKLRNDIFRHWVLGLGSGDIRLLTNSGHRQEEQMIHNVLFADRKVAALQDLIVVKPDQVQV